MEWEFIYTGSVPNWGAYGLWEYLLIAPPDEKVNKKVVLEKELFYQCYREQTAIKTKPHITVACFLGKSHMEKAISQTIQLVCNQHQAFSVILNCFNGFYPHTIYLNVLNHYPFKQLCKQLKQINAVVQLHKCPPVQISTIPHLTIARQLPASIFHKAVAAYQQRSFHESFKVNELLLLRRKHQYHYCEPVTHFPLLSQQLSLFP